MTNQLEDYYGTAKISVPKALVPIVTRMCDRYRELIKFPDDVTIKEEIKSLLTSFDDV